MKDLQNYNWPGNIRELRNVIERAMIITSDNTLKVELPEYQNSGDSNDKTFFEVQRKHIIEILKSTDWKVRGKGGAAAILALKPTTLEAKIAKLGIKRPQAKASRSYKSPNL